MRTTLYAAFSDLGVPAINVWDFDRKRLETLVSDRHANGQALPGEPVVRCTVEFYRRAYESRGWRVPDALAATKPASEGE